MLLIGSLAAKHHFQDFREPRGDIDLIATPQEVSFLESLSESNNKSSFEGKRDFTISGKHVDVEVALHDTTALELLPHSSSTTHIESIGEVDVATPDVLFLLKKSHVAFRLYWPKNFRDYKFLQSKGCHIPGYIHEVFTDRIEETKKRLSFIDHDFNVKNEEFFKTSVNRYIPHDDIHDLVKIGNEPIFKKIKLDSEVAEISFSLFESLPFHEKIWNMQEECMALACERHIIPSVKKGEPFSEKIAAKRILLEMCYNYLPFDFRFFAIDFFQDIYWSIPWGFSKRVLDSIP